MLIPAPFAYDASKEGDPFMSDLQRRLGATLREQAGQGLPEYALILGLIAVFCMVTLSFLGGQIASMLELIAETITP